MKTIILFAVLLILPMCVYPDVVEQLAQQTDKPFWVEYFWNLMAVGAAPLIGFMFGQLYKAWYQNHYKGGNPPQLYTMFLAGLMAGLIAGWYWPDVVEFKVKLGVAVGFLQIILVKAWFAFVRTKAPEEFNDLIGSGTEMTIVPGVKVKVPPSPKE